MKENLREKGISVIILVVLGLWIIGILLQFLNAWGYNNDYENLLRFYGQIAMTLFGFTLIGGIFEKGRKQPEIVKKLFDSSLLFLMTTICFFFAYSMSSIVPDAHAKADLISLPIVISFGFAMLFGFIGLVVGMLQLYQLLRVYRNSF